MDNQEFNSRYANSPDFKHREVEMILQNVSKKKSVSDILLHDHFPQASSDIDFFTSETLDNETTTMKREVEQVLTVQPLLLGTKRTEILDSSHTSNAASPFIISNTVNVDLEHLQNDCIIPVFSKDNERTISHQEFIEVAFGKYC